VKLRFRKGIGAHYKLPTYEVVIVSEYQPAPMTRTVATVEKVEKMNWRIRTDPPFRLVADQGSLEDAKEAIELAVLSLLGVKR